VTKFALPALALLIFGLFYFSVTSQEADAPPESAGARAEPTQPIASAEKAEPDRVQQLEKAVESVGAELKRLSDEAKANGDKIAQSLALRSDPQDSRSSSEKTVQTVIDQVEALRSDQAKSLRDTREANDKAVQALRQEVAAAQTRMAAQLGDTLKTSTARSETLAQRVDAMKKELDDIKKRADEDRQNISNISPGLALVVALAALVLGPFVARQLTANQIAAARKQAADEAAAERSRPVKTAEPEPPLAPTAADLSPGTTLAHEAPALGEEAAPQLDAEGNRRDPEKV
jgi:hypothetical protein